MDDHLDFNFVHLDRSEISRSIICMFRNDIFNTGSSVYIKLFSDDELEHWFVDSLIFFHN